MSWLDQFLTGYNTVQSAGAALVQRVRLNFLGGSVTAVDNPGTETTDVTIDTSAFDWATLTSAGFEFIKTIPGAFGAVRVGIEDKDPGTSTTGTSIVYTGQNASGSGSTGGLAAFAAGAGENGGDAFIAGGLATSATGKGGDLYLSGGDLADVDTGSIGGTVKINASSADTPGHVEIGISGSSALKIETTGITTKTPQIVMGDADGNLVATLDTSDSSTLFATVVGVYEVDAYGVNLQTSAQDITLQSAVNVRLSAQGTGTDGNIELTGRIVRIGGTLTNGNETINVGSDVDWSFIGAITANRTKTLGVTGVYDAAELWAYVVNTGAFTMAFVNGGASGGTLITIASATSMTLQFVWDAFSGASGDWVLATARIT